MTIVCFNHITLNNQYEDLFLALNDKRYFKSRNGRKTAIGTIVYNNNSTDIWFRVPTLQFEESDSLKIEIREGNLGFGIYREYQLR